MRIKFIATGLVVLLSSTMLINPANADDSRDIEMLKQQVGLLQKRIVQLESAQEKSAKTEDVASIVSDALKERSTGSSFFDGVDVRNLVGTSPEYADMMLNWQNDVSNKPRKLLNARQDGKLNHGVTVSGGFKGSFMAETTDTEDKFAVLSRFPSQHSGSTGTRFVVNNAAIGVTGVASKWITSYAQLEYSEIEFTRQDELQLRKAYVTIGNLNESPFYGYFGRNSVDFGDMDSYNPFTHNTVNHYFQTVSDAPVAAIGYYDGDWEVVATAINGGRHLRVADTTDSGHVKNFAVKADRWFDMGQERNVRVGASYLHGTIYNATPHHPGDPAASAWRDRNAAWGAVVEYTSPSLDLMAEFVSTVDDWPATDAPVSALVLQGEYKVDLLDRHNAFSVVYGLGTQGDDGTQWERMEQAVLGYEIKWESNLYFGAEYVYNHGWAPLVDITTVADRDVENHSIILGTRYTF